MSSGSQQLSYSERSAKTDHFDWDPEEGNNMDLDDGNSETCSACLLPIFLTPFNRDHNNEDVLMHDECSGEFPPELKGHVLHPKGDLILHRQHPSTPLDARPSCASCGSTCGTIFYKCPDDSNCNFTLDLKCAWPIRVLHRSHRHRLTVKRRRGCSFICYACGFPHERHTRDEWVLCYECADCDFQIHGDCSVLPNAIVVQHHPHPLLLQYYYRGYFYADYVCNICKRIIFERYYERERDCYECGYYACVHCWFTNAHINCAIQPFQHKSVLIRNAQVPNLLRLPMENEYTSVMACVMKANYTNEYNEYDGSGASNCDGDDNTTNNDDSKSSLFQKSILHKDRLILLDADGIDRVCNACIQIISPLDPYYTCIYNYNGNHNNNKSKKNSKAGCTDFVLHSSCVHLPTTSVLQQQLPVSLKPNTSLSNIFWCARCFRSSNGPFYYMDDLPLADVVCANMPFSITHDAHARTHILFISQLSSDSHKICNCCGKGPSFGFWYRCNSCRNFFIHAYCALLPNTVRHKFDRHPLKLVATTKKDGHERGEDEQQMLLCEICEMDIDKRYWYYSCTQCDHSFHIRCIPYFDHLSKIKLGFTLRVGCHDCPVSSVRALSVDGYRCGDCGEHIRESDDIAFECSKCYFRMHIMCVVKYMSKQ